MPATPTKEAIIGIFQNGRSDQNDFLQLKSAVGGNIFGWIDYLGVLQGSLATGAIPAGSDTDVQVNSGGAFYGDGNFTWDKTTQILNLAGVANITTAATAGLTLTNPTASTALVTGQPAPQVQISGTVWNGSASITDEWVLVHTPVFIGAPTNAAQSTLTLKHTAGASASQTIFSVDSSTIGVINIDTKVVTGALVPAGLLTLIGSFNGTVYNLTSAGNASGGLTTYQGSFPVETPQPGMYLTIAGFTNGANNGRFLVQSATSSQAVVFNAGGIAETHAATATLDNPYALGGLWTLQGQGTSTGRISILGTSYNQQIVVSPYPNSPAFSIMAEGDATDAGYWRPVSLDSSDHGIEEGAIIDGTGAAPVAMQRGVFNGITGHTFAQLKAATNVANVSSSSVVIQSQYWTGTASAKNSWSLADILGTGSNPTSTLTIQQSGTSGAALLSVIAPFQANTVVVTAVAPTVAAGQVGIGATTATSASAGANGGVPAQVAGYLIINVAGTSQKVPFYNV